MNGTRKAVFLDKDGTLVENVPYNVDPLRIRLEKGAAEGVRRLQDHGFLPILISNQSGVARGYFSMAEVWAADRFLRELLAGLGIGLIDSFYCPHHPKGALPEYTGSCECRKPAAGLVVEAARVHQIDLSASWMIGDILDDVEAGNRSGCRTVLIDNDHETEWILNRQRIPDLTAADLNVASLLILAAERPQSPTGKALPNTLNPETT